MTTRLGDVVARTAVSLPSLTTVREVAARMNEAHVTSMLLVDDGELVGIVTDRDLRRRVIVEGVAPERAVADIMTPSPIVAGVDDLAHDALLLMARHGIHHLPVVDADALVGVVTASDFVERRGSSTVRLAASIHRAPSAASLVAERERIDALYARLVRGGTAAARIGRVTSGVVDALTIRLLELAATEAGLAIPERLVWLVAGSQARREWHIGSVAANGPLIEGLRGVVRRRAGGGGARAFRRRRPRPLRIRDGRRRRRPQRHRRRRTALRRGRLARARHPLARRGRESTPACRPPRYSISGPCTANTRRSRR